MIGCKKIRISAVLLLISTSASAGALGSSAPLQRGRDIMLCLEERGITIKKSLADLSPQEWDAYLQCSRIAQSMAVKRLCPDRERSKGCLPY